MASAQVLPTSRKQEHLEAGKRKVPFFFLSILYFAMAMNVKRCVLINLIGAVLLLILHKMYHILLLPLTTKLSQLVFFFGLQYDSRIVSLLDLALWVS